MSRLLVMTFFGHFRGGHEAEHHLHESPWNMLTPLVLLATGTVAIGILRYTKLDVFVKIPDIVAPVFRLEPEHEHHIEWLPYLATATAATGILLALWFYLKQTDLPGKIASAFGPLTRLFEAKYYFDEVYNAFARIVIVGGSESVLWKRLDAGLIDGLVNGVGWAWDGIAARARYAQTGFVRSYALLMLAGAVAIVGYLLWS
jgi:NADH-quinone oxidoreductase subunit L